jgi:hypothetical protein
VCVLHGALELQPLPGSRKHAYFTHLVGSQLQAF